MKSVTEGNQEGSLAGAIRVEDEQVRRHVDAVVRESVETTLNGLLEAEAAELCGASRYERSSA